MHTGAMMPHRGFEECKEGELGCVYSHADNRRGDVSKLMGYNYDGSHCVQIPWIRVRDIPVYKTSVPALAMVMLLWTLSCEHPCLRVLWVPTTIEYQCLLKGH